MPPVRDPKQARTWNSPVTGASPPSSDVRTALERLREFFRERTTRAGLIARRVLGMPRKDDGLLADQLIAERRRRTRLNGSIDGSLVKTAWAAWELLELDCPPDHTAIVRTVGWVLDQQNKPGRFGEGCAPDRHERRLCRHFLSGFFSAGTADQDVAPLEFQSGVSITAEDDARFAASCFALRTVLRAREDRRAVVIEHLDSLMGLLEQPDTLDSERSPDLAFFALGAVALAPIRYRDGLERLVERILSDQDETGQWPGVSPFHACEMLLSVPTAPAREALRRTIPGLLDRQRPDGAFDPAGGEETALTGLRVLLLAT